jgi:hypothetical protein
MIATKSRGFTVVVALSWGAAACKPDPGTGPSPSASSVAPSARPVIGFPIPTGPRLSLLAGQGAGAIRLGASQKTVERLMEAPCDEKSPTHCRYVGRAIEFEFADDGKLRKLHAHRHGRAAGAGKSYGVFNGAIPPDIAFGMLIPAVQEILGPPEKTVEGNAGAAPETVSQHFYKGMVLEYDRAPNGKIVLGGVRIPE